MASPLLSSLARRCAAAAARPAVLHAGCGAPAAAASPALCAASAARVGVRWATSKAGGSTKNGRDSKPKMLGVKRYGGQRVEPGCIIVRQRGQRYGIVESTQTVALGRDHTVYALKPGYVRFWWHAMRKKFFIEVVTSPHTERVVGKYPITRLDDWELPSLLALPADTQVAPSIVDRLAAWIRGLNVAQKLAAVPRGMPLVGGVEAVAWGAAAKGGAARGAAKESGAPAAAAAAAAVVGAAPDVVAASAVGV